MKKRRNNRNTIIMSIPKVYFLLAMAVAVISGSTGDIRRSGPEFVSIVHQSRDGPNPDGSYKWSYETANGIQAQEEGHLEQSKKTNEEAIAVKGSYSYQLNNGEPIQVTYTANENGFQPRGSHLPTPPPIPASIIRALEWIAAHPEEDNL